MIFLQNQENFHQIRKNFSQIRKNLAKLGKIWPNQKILVHIRKVHKENEEKFGKLRKLENFIRKNNRISGKLTPISDKLEVGPKKREKKSSSNFHWEIRKIQLNQESSFGRLGKLGKLIRKILSSILGKSLSTLVKFFFNIRKILPQKTGFQRQKHFSQLCPTITHSVPPLPNDWSTMN